MKHSGHDFIVEIKLINSLNQLKYITAPSNSKTRVRSHQNPLEKKTVLENTQIDLVYHFVKHFPTLAPQKKNIIKERLLLLSIHQAQINGHLDSLCVHPPPSARPFDNELTLTHNHLTVNTFSHIVRELPSTSQSHTLHFVMVLLLLHHPPPPPGYHSLNKRPSFAEHNLMPSEKNTKTFRGALRCDEINGKKRKKKKKKKRKTRFR